MAFEGAEYLLLEEVIESNILCVTVQKQGVSIHMMMELHDDDVLDTGKKSRDTNASSTEEGS